MEETLTYYVAKFSKLKTDRGNAWSESPQTMHRAPHKPLLLLSVLDRFSEGVVQANLIELDPDLCETFASYWSIVMPPERRGNIAMPFFHLQSDGFWHLLPQPGHQIRGKIHSIARLKEAVIGAKLDDELHALLQAESSRNALRTVLIDTYFSPEVGTLLMQQGAVNQQAYRYSQALVTQARARLEEQGRPFDSQAESAVRDQGFRLVVRRAYNYQCAMTGIRLITDSGHIAVVGAHIVPWSVNQNDSPTNGIALSPTCHWAFDEGLLTITPEYRIKSSPQLRKGDNVPKHMAELNKKPILLPAEESFWPDQDALEWHNRHVFQRR